MMMMMMMMKIRDGVSVGYVFCSIAVCPLRHRGRDRGPGTSTGMEQSCGLESELGLASWGSG